MNPVSKNRVLLSDNQLTALSLRVSGLSYEQVGERMNCSRMSGYNYIRNAMKQVTKARDCEARLVKI